VRKPSPSDTKYSRLLQLEVTGAVVKLLVDQGENVNALGGYYDNSLYAALGGGVR
jgi:hypothetical protein